MSWFILVPQQTNRGKPPYFKKKMLPAWTGRSSSTFFNSQSSDRSWPIATSAFTPSSSRDGANQFFQSTTWLRAFRNIIVNQSCVKMYSKTWIQRKIVCFMYLDVNTHTNQITNKKWVQWGLELGKLEEILRKVWKGRADLLIRVHHHKIDQQIALIFPCNTSCLPIAEPGRSQIVLTQNLTSLVIWLPSCGLMIDGPTKMRGVTFDMQPSHLAGLPNLEPDRYRMSSTCCEGAVGRLAGELQQSRTSTARPRLGAKSMKQKKWVWSEWSD